ncbi:AAA family ATPase [Colletotrichum truncatum]|uniref:AAA family ATPase n=1 Tax=Colletotrichum truncatum TaxID=5467 RepID=A0ACC3YQ26_COLTU|nr:AAA family ATPase [Colletotrichum truncatum]KAF6796730.1 AAA family ATPase [Colletotrichum truncatum]
MSSTDGSSFISEHDIHDDTESKATTPSASPRKINDVNESLEAGEAENVEQLHNNDRSVSERGSEAGDEDDDGSGDSRASHHSIAWRLRNVASDLRELTAGPIVPVNTDTENLKILMSHLNMLEWISSLLKEVPSRSNSVVSIIAERVKCVPELRGYKFQQWVPPPPAPPYFRKDSNTPAIAFLTEEPQFYTRGTPHSPFRTSQLSSSNFNQPSRPHGVGYLPPQIRVNSLPVMRILSTVTGGLLNAAPHADMNIYRPYKVLVYFEKRIRSELAFLGEQCAEAARETEEANAAAASHVKSDDEKQGKPESDSDSVASVESDTSQNIPGRYSVPEYLLFQPAQWRHHTLDLLQEAKADLGILIEFMDKYVFPLRKALKEEADMRVHFNELWHLYVPGSLVYVRDPGVPQKLWRVIQGTGGNRTPLVRPPENSHVSHLKLGASYGNNKLDPLILDCYYVDFDGTHFVRVLKKFRIEEFKELTAIKGLPILPINVAESEDLINIEESRQRGFDFIACTRPTYRYFRGRSLCYEPEGNVMRRPEKETIGSLEVLSESIESPVVVDFERCLQMVPDWRPCKVPMELTTPYKDSPPPPSNLDDERNWDVRMAEEVLNYTDQSQTLEWHSRTPPSGEEVLLLPGRVFAYVLRTRRWASLPLAIGKPDEEGNSLTLMEPDPSAWDLLQIDQRHRSIIESMMATHFRKKKSERRQFDLIQDKGKGLIVLLHGVPGVGKTSTAETVAQYYNKPLLPITCGDLGMTPAEVEANLQSSFQLAQAWDCVLLLDEADVFLAERSQDNIERNALVSVFLRVMEYYEGILFLTTNKVGSFDEAFKSRMSMALYYPPLTQDQTEKIWVVQIERTERLSIEAAPEDKSQHVKFNRLDIMTLAKELWSLQQARPDFKPVWNGRQIRNAFQTAVALAEWHQQENKIPGPVIVKREHFEKVALVSNEFNAYLWTVKHRRGDDVLNWKKEHRFDQFDRYQSGWGGPGFGQQQPSQPGFGAWDNSQQSGMMGFGSQSGLGIGGFGNNNMQNQTGFINPQSWQSGLGGIGRGNMGVGNPGVGSSGMASNLGSGLQVVPGQNLTSQTTEQQQQQLQQQQLQQLQQLQQQQQQQQSQTNLQPGGPMQAMFGQSTTQPRSTGW